MPAQRSPIFGADGEGFGEGAEPYPYGGIVGFLTQEIPAE
jgi:hypothetical protein